MTSFSLILWSVSFARSFPPKVSSGARARGALGAETLHKIQCRKFRASIRFQSTPVTSFERVISGVSSLARVDWGRTVERSRTIFALRFVPAFSRIHRDIRPGLLNFCRPLVAAGKPSFLPLVQACKQASGSFFHSFQVSPGGFPFDAHLTPSAPARGLVRVSDAHRDTKRKRSWVTNIGSETT